MVRSALVTLSCLWLSVGAAGQSINATGQGSGRSISDANRVQDTAAQRISALDSASAQAPGASSDDDTVLVLRAGGDKERDTDSAELEEVKADGEGDHETRGVGAAAFSANLLSLDTRPLEKIAHNEGDLAGKNFDFRNNTFLTFGIMGYGGPRHGICTGASVWGGYKVFYSDEYSTKLTDPSRIARNGGDSIVDSVAALHVGLGYVTFLAEKHLRFFQRLDVLAGGMIGGGAMVVVKDFMATDDASGFHDASGSATMRDSTGVNARVALTPLWTFDLHAGLSYRFAPWLSIGIEANALFLYSSSGFGYGYGSFGATNPGGRLRIVLGNAG